MLLPAFLCAHIFIEREGETSGYEAASYLYALNRHALQSADPCIIIYLITF